MISNSQIYQWRAIIDRSLKDFENLQKFSNNRIKADNSLISTNWKSLKKVQNQ